LTMIHEVMILDHSGPELAALQLGSAIKLTAGLGLIASLLNPFAGQATGVTVAVNVAIVLLLSVVIGTIESLIARLSLRALPQYIVVALIAAGAALLTTAWGAG